MEIIKRWLKERVGIEVQQQRVGAQFANGYQLGLVLEAYGLQTDMDRFINKDSPDAKLANFQRLQPTFRSLNIKFDSHSANQLMTEEPGIAMQLLQELKVKLDVAQPVGSRAPTGRSRGSTALLLTTNRMASKSKFKQMEESAYDTTLRLKTADPREFRIANHLRAFEEEAIRQQREAEVMDALDMMTKQQRLADGRDMLRTKLAENRAYLQDWEREGKINHAKNQATAKERERRDLRLELAMREKARRTRALDSDTAAQDMASGIDTFEDSLRRIQDAVDVPVDEALLSKTATESPHEFLQSLAGRVPRSLEMQKESEQYMTKVKERRIEDTLARKERDRRRRRVLVEQMRTHKDMVAKKREESIKEKLLRQSAEEERIADRLNTSLGHKEAMRRERLAREEQYRALREEQLIQTRARDVQVYGTMRREYTAKLERERARFAELEQQRKAARWQKHYNLCRAIVDQMVDLTAKTCEYRAVTQGNLVPSKQWREWLVTFTAGLPLYPEEAIDDATLAEALPGEEEKIAVLQDLREYESYLDLEDEWQAPPPSKEGGEEAGEEGNAAGECSERRGAGGNVELGAAIRDMRRVLEVPIPPPEVPKDVALPEVRIAVTGAPLAGVSRQADMLAQQLGLTVIRVQADLAEAVAGYETTMSEWDSLVAAAKEAAGEDGEVEEVPRPDFSELPTQVLGGRAREALAEGKPVPDDILVDLIVERLKTIEGRGYVLDGFPATVEQAKALEARLAGVEDRHVHPPLRVAASRLAPAPAEEESDALPLVSCLTSHLRLHVDKEISLRRRLGRMVDPEDSLKCAATYHIEFDPPPQDDTALCARLVEAPDADNADMLTRSASYTDERALMTAWLKRFGGILTEVDATETVEEVATAIKDLVEKRLEALQKAPTPEPSGEATEPPAAEPPAATPEGSEEVLEGDEKAAGEEAAEAGEEAAVAKVLAPVALHPDVAQILLETWARAEGEFEHNMRRVLRSMRDRQREAINWIADCRNKFLLMLSQPNAQKLKIIHAFQAMFNSIDMEVRVIEETKTELHTRADDLANTLWELSDAERDAAEAERTAVMEDTFLSDANTRMLTSLVELVQQEVYRFQASQNILRDFHYSRNGKTVPVETAAPLNIVDQYVDGAFAGSPVDLGEEASALTEEDRELMGQLSGAITAAVDELCQSPDYAAPGTEADAEGDAAMPALLRGIKTEEALFKARTGALLRRGREILEDLRQREQELHTRLDAMLGQRFRTEMEGVAGLIKEIKTRVESGERLLHELKLDVTDVIKDENSLTYAVVPKPPGLQAREELPPFKLSTAQLGRVVKWLQSASPSGHILLGVLVSVLHRAAAQAGMKLLPAQWITLPPSQLHALLICYETGAREGLAASVDWRRVMWTLADVPPATVEQLRKLLAAAKSKGVTLEALPAAALSTVPLWFESLPPPETYTDSDNGQLVVKGHPPPLLKQALLSIFTNPNTGTVNLLHLVLYACAGTLADAVDKAVRVIGNADGSVDRDSLLSILSLGSMSCFHARSASPTDAEIVDAALAAASEGKNPGTSITVSDLMLTEKGLAFVSSCQGLEAKSPYTMLNSKL